ncbi:hypothetical protein [Saccharomonospora piscinae]|uniref:hypothetical protein n=1 Tax=Saccharomonospora piscinae TaxID=687388 RepID=UPI000462F3B6|nr:hypothetical protein [Saccharomonospora piscinae]
MSRSRAPDRALRGIRGVLLASCSAILSVTAHTLGGGHLPHLVPTVAMTVLIGWVSTALASQTRGRGGILLVLGGAQLVTHLVLGELSGHAVEGPAMLACHVVATVVTALVLAHAEAMLAVAISALWALRVLFVVVCGSPAPEGTAPLGGTPQGAFRAVEVLLRRAHPLRGPPPTS